MKETTAVEGSIPIPTPAPAPHRAKLSRDRVIEAALRIMDEEGLDAVSMRRVAHELGVEAMSLYHHVGDKDELLDGICERVMGDFEFPELTGDWAQDCRAGARAWRRLMQKHPEVIELWLCVVRLKDWFVPPLQAHCWYCVPSTVEPFVSSRHLPLKRFTKW